MLLRISALNWPKLVRTNTRGGRASTVTRSAAEPVNQFSTSSVQDSVLSSRLASVFGLILETWSMKACPASLSSRAQQVRKSFMTGSLRR